MVRPRVKFLSPNWPFPQLVLPQLTIFPFFCAIENLSPPTAGKPFLRTNQNIACYLWALPLRYILADRRASPLRKQRYLKSIFLRIQIDINY